MPVRKIVCINKNNIVIIPLPLSQENPIDEAMLAGIDSGGKWFEIDSSAPVTIGWKYENKKLIDPQGNVWAS